MDFILITFAHTRLGQIDMKIPAFMQAGEFIDIMRGLYGITGRTIQAEPIGYALDNTLSFTEQKVEHGALLTLCG